MPDRDHHPGLTPRQQQILDLARTHGQVLVEPLADAFEVTPQTVRRDLNQLCKLRLLQRMHGGAVIHDGVENLGYAARKRLARAEKAAIGACAARLVGSDSSLFINIGTTTEQVAEHLVGHAGLLVITNNLNVVNILRGQDSIEVMTAGGTVRRGDGGIVGETTADFFAQFKVDHAIVGASAIEEDGALLDYDVREVRVTQAIIRNSRSVILVADAIKFERNAPVRIGHIGQVDHFVTDRMPPEPLRRLCSEHDVSLHIATPAEAQ